MNKNFTLLITLFFIGIGLLIYERILFDIFDFYSNILDIQLIGLTMVLISMIFLIFKKEKKKLLNITLTFSILLLLSLLILYFIAKHHINNYPKLF